MTGHTRAVRALQFDEVKLITGSMDHTIKVWDWRTGKCLRTLEGGCSVPVGVHTTFVEDSHGSQPGGRLKIVGAVTSLGGERHVEHAIEEDVRSAAEAEAVEWRLSEVEACLRRAGRRVTAYLCATTW